MKFLRRRVLRRFGAPLAALLIRLLGASVRLRVQDPHGVLDKLGREPMIFAFWHCRILLMPYIYRKLVHGRRLKVMMSRSRDGEFISEVAARFGIEAVRGSSSRGGIAALLEIARALRQGGCDMGITPDGPRGPRCQVQEGILALARHSGAPVVPIYYHTHWKWEAGSWDRFQVPFPFTCCDLYLGEPILARDLDDGALRGAIERGLNGGKEALVHAT